jgi:hypothetical protein
MQILGVHKREANTRQEFRKKKKKEMYIKKISNKNKLIKKMYLHVHGYVCIHIHRSLILKYG